MPYSREFRNLTRQFAILPDKYRMHRNGRIVRDEFLHLLLSCPTDVARGTVFEDHHEILLLNLRQIGQLRRVFGRICYIFAL